jgi:hypothetical protein
MQLILGLGLDAVLVDVRRLRRADPGASPSELDIPNSQAPEAVRWTSIRSPLAMTEEAEALILHEPVFPTDPFAP